MKKFLICRVELKEELGSFPASGTKGKFLICRVELKERN